MAKKRVIFKLIYNEGYFNLSRNFFLQKAGDVGWLFDKMNFHKISMFIDELIILNASANNSIDPLPKQFKENIKELMKKTFIPLTIGGGLTKISQVDECFNIGADKVLLNSVLSNNVNFVKKCTQKYGAQSISIGIDFKFDNKKSKYYSFINNGKKTFLQLEEHFKIINKINFGELILTSIDRDGTGFGFDEKVLHLLKQKSKYPVLLSGGAGKPKHFEELIKNRKISGLVTGNLYNFLGNGLEILRERIISKGINLRIL